MPCSTLSWFESALGTTDAMLSVLVVLAANAEATTEAAGAFGGAVVRGSGVVSHV